MFRYPAQLPFDLAPYGAHDTQRGALEPLPVSTEAADLEAAVLGLLAVLLVVQDRRSRLAAGLLPTEVGAGAGGRDVEQHRSSPPPRTDTNADADDGSRGGSSVRGAGDVDGATAAASSPDSSMELVTTPPSVAEEEEEPVAARPLHPSRPNPFDIPELRLMILGHVPVDNTFDAGLLRVHSGWHAHFHPRLYRSINLAAPRRKPLAFVRSLEALSDEALGALRVGYLQFRLRDEDRAEELLLRLYRQLRRSEAFARSIQTLSAFVCFAADEEDDDTDARQLADIVAACPGLTRLVFKNWVMLGHYTTFMDRLLSCHPASVLQRVAQLVLEIPPEPFLYRDKTRLPTPPQVKTLRTFFVAPKDGAGIGDISVYLLSTLIRYMDGIAPEAKTLVLGPALATFVARESCSKLVQLEVALAQRLVKEKGDALGCRVLFPKELKVAELLDADPTFQDLGLMGTIVLWEGGLWPEMNVPVGG